MTPRQALRHGFRLGALALTLSLLAVIDRAFPVPFEPRSRVPYVCDVTALDLPELHGYREARGFELWEPLQEPGTTVQDRFSWIPAGEAYSLGGSVARGNGASIPERSWRARLGLTNAASGAWVSAQERVCLELALLPRKPRLVVVLDGWNDLANPALTGSRPGDPHGWELAGARETWSHAWAAKRRFDLSSALRERASRILASPRLLNGYLCDVVDSWRDSTERLIERCREAGVPCAVFLQPCRQLVEKPATPELELVRLACERAIANLPAGVTDLSRLLPADRFVDLCHPDDKGHEILAAAVLAKEPATPAR